MSTALLPARRRPRRGPARGAAVPALGRRRRFRARRSTGDVVVLGAGGKMGPSLARRVRPGLRRGRREAPRPRRRALLRARPRATRSSATASSRSRATCSTPRRWPGCRGVENVLFLAGRKFGSSGRPDLTWAQNVVVPSIVAPHFAGSRIVVFSSGNVYPLVPPGVRGLDRDGRRSARSASTPRPASAASGSSSTPRASAARACLFFRLFYAVDLRYGTLVDVARKVHAGEPVDLRASATSTRSGRATRTRTPSARSRSARAPPRPLVVTGPEVVSVRAAAEAFGERFGRAPRFTGEPGPALLGDPALCASLLGPPEVPLARLVDWVAAWVRAGRAQPGQAHALRGHRWPILKASPGFARCSSRGWSSPPTRSP